MGGGVLTSLVAVSNRVTVATDSKARAGGLAVALQDALAEHGGIWFGWSGKVRADPDQTPMLTKVGRITYATLDLGRQAYNEYYNGFANRTLWPLFHYRLDLTAFSQQTYTSYLGVNRLFATHLSTLLRRDSIVWIHDYHLIPLGHELRRVGVTQPMGFFLHTPFPSMEILTALPAHRALVEALCAYDVVGFQTQNDLRAFLDYVVHEAGGEILGDHLIRSHGRTLRVEIFPIGIDTEAFVRAGRESESTRGGRKIARRPEGRTWIMGVDRLDYSKGLVERFQAFERLLERYAAYRGKLTFVQIAPPSRSEVPEYREIRRSLEAEAGHINGRFAEFDWLPINYINRSYNRASVAALYRASRIGLVTPLRDGMNLVAKEYVATQSPHDPGVLVLSRFAGAARELREALIVNPFDLDAVADAIVRGLEMPVEERRERWDSLMQTLRHNTLSHWRDNFLKALVEAPYGP